MLNILVCLCHSKCQTDLAVCAILFTRQTCLFESFFLVKKEHFEPNRHTDTESNTQYLLNALVSKFAEGSVYHFTERWNM